MGRIKMTHRSYLLELTSVEAFVPKEFSRGDVLLRRAAKNEVGSCRSLWLEVGRGFWNERAEWIDEQWLDHLGRPDVSFWIAHCGGENIGFFELVAEDDVTKIEGFGLVEKWRGLALGGGLLSAAVQSAFSSGANRIWLHTATDDHPHALPNYKARGFAVYQEWELKEPMPIQTPDRTRLARPEITGSTPQA
jgi:GNAT superfamily N-acetyltransferase